MQKLLFLIVFHRIRKILRNEVLWTDVHTPGTVDTGTGSQFRNHIFCPAGYGVYSFGLNALIMLILSVASCVATEYIYEKAMHKVVTIGDFSAVVTGLLLGMNLPAQTIIGTVAGNDGKKVLYMGGLWLPIIGGIFAILVVKMVFGGLGQNFMNPALGARCFLLISFPVWMNHFMPMANDTMVDATTTATPLTALKAGQTAGNLMEMLGKTHISEMVTGKGIGGVIGETSMIAIVIGACILILAGIIVSLLPTHSLHPPSTTMAHVNPSSPLSHSSSPRRPMLRPMWLRCSNRLDSTPHASAQPR